MKNPKSDKKPVYDKYQLGIYSGIKITLNIPNRHYKKADKENKYFLESYYLQKQKQYKESVRDMYNDYISSLRGAKITAAAKLDGLSELYSLKIKDIVSQFNVTSTTELKINMNAIVLDVINRYFEYQLKQHQIGELAGVANYRDRNKKLNIFFGSDTKKYLILKQLNKEVWEDFRIYLLGTGLLKSSVNQYLTYVKSFYNWMIIDKEVAIVNHPQQLKKLDESQQIPKYKELSSDLIHDFFNVLDANPKYIRLHILSLLVLENTVRPIQVRELQHKYINLEANELLVYDKKGKKWRTIIITDRAKQLIQVIYDNTISAGVTVTDDMYLLGGFNRFKSGLPMSDKGMRQDQITKFREEYSQFNMVRIYEMKYTAITKTSKTDLATAQKRAGHRKITTTQIYDKSESISVAVSLQDLVNKY